MCQDPSLFKNGRKAAAVPEFSTALLTWSNSGSGSWCQTYLLGVIDLGHEISKPWRAIRNYEVGVFYTAFQNPSCFSLVQHWAENPSEPNTEPRGDLFKFFREIWASFPILFWQPQELAIYFSLMSQFPSPIYNLSEQNTRIHRADRQFFRIITPFSRWYVHTVLDASQPISPSGCPLSLLGAALISFKAFSYFVAILVDSHPPCAKAQLLCLLQFDSVWKNNFSFFLNKP